MTYLSFALGLSLLFVGCGKKAQNNSIPDTRIPELKPSELELILSRQDVACDANQACPNYISKIVVVNKGKINYCTGFLVNETTVATSANCLPDLIRRNGQSCDKDIFLFFPKTANRPAERVGCKTVLQVSQLHDTEPALWRDDVSFLQLDRPLEYRRQASISREGIKNNKEYSTWFVDQLDDMTAIIRRDSCEALYDTYVNPLVSAESSPNLVFGKCSFRNGNNGAPILDSRGKVRAIVSRPMSSKLRDYINSTGLLIQPLKAMLHATNFACSPTIFDNNVLDERECAKDLNYSKLDKLRSDMLATTMLFSDMKKKFEESLENKSKYIKFGVKLISNGDTQETQIYPKCFKPLSGWLDSLNGTRNTYVFEIPLPNKVFRRAMDENGRILGATISAPDKSYFFQFSLKQIRSYKVSTIYMWNSSENYTFPSVTESCN